MQLPSLDDSWANDLIGVSGMAIPGCTDGNFAPPGAWDAEKYSDILKKGDGNAAVAYIVKALKEGAITPEYAKELAKDVQQTANAAGGGRINREMRDALKEALGTDTDFIAKGKTRAQIGFEKFWKILVSVCSFGLL